MKKVMIPKGHGKKRLIYVPTTSEKATLFTYLPELNFAAYHLCTHAHGFVAGRSPVSNAAMHVHKEHTLTADIKDFFDSVAIDNPAFSALLHMTKRSSIHYYGACFPDKVAHQGLPTSPALANIAGKAIDDAIVRILTRDGLDFVYTRYADDMSVSWNGPRDAAQYIEEKLNVAVLLAGFRLSPNKTHLQSVQRGSSTQRRVICGVAIDPDGSLHPTRKTKRRLRAAVHQFPENNATKGLRAWCRLTPPSEEHFIFRFSMRCGKHLHTLGITPELQLVAFDHSIPEIQAQMVRSKLASGYKPSPCASAVMQFGPALPEVVTDPTYFVTVTSRLQKISTVKLDILRHAFHSQKSPWEELGVRR
jgi:hypothetical protein